ncbi:diguanylate cyclase [uncultured Methylibium sp.]|uniref:diguanylate cyclase n=1 Tax=uncultured Methylibium sp. TaxID=381093 RepID=UPI0025E3DDBB|nr:diguanylate cyclase [uncultured Methylibium sp.]
MASAQIASRASEAVSLARQAWRLLHLDAARAITLADRALAVAQAHGDAAGEGWARLARGFHLLYFARPRDAAPELRAAQKAFDAVGDRAGHVLARTGLARGLWREGRFDESLDAVLALRDEGMQVLRHDQRGVLLNTIAGCYSARNQSEQAFAYMYQALRDARPARGHGFDIVLHCNLAHELLQLGDYDEALRHIDAGLARSDERGNARLVSVLLINRVICLTELERAAEALPDVARVQAIPTGPGGRGRLAAHFETLAIAALRAGDGAVGRALVERAREAEREDIPEERIELAIAAALLARAEGDLDRAVAGLEAERPALERGDKGLSLRVRCSALHVLSQALEARGDAADALATLRLWQGLAAERARLASQAHAQAAALQTELLLLQRKLDEKDAQRRATERAHAELAAINGQLSQKIAEVQALQAALQQQATRDALTGLFNRRHLNEALPALWAAARRDGRPLAVAIIDLDHFKQVNDRHGHDVGDRLLAAFGQLLATRLRRGDIACRYGGEEFCVLMPGTEAGAARRKLESLLRRWRAEALLMGGAEAAGTTFSAGVADSQGDGDSGQSLLKRADEALLDAKREGRCRVRLARAAAGAAA